MNNSRKNENFETTEGLALIWELTAQPENLVFHSHQAELENMWYSESEHRWPAVYGCNGSITITVPRAGRFYPGVVVYDGDLALKLYAHHQKETLPGPCSYEMSVDGKVVGRFFPKENDNRQRLFFLNEPVEFKGGERITICTGPAGGHLTEDIFLLRERPPIRKRGFAIKNIETGFVTENGKDAMRLTWITTWPAQCRIEYGQSADAMKTVVESSGLANHRVYLDNLEANAAYRFRIIAPRPDGDEVRSDEMTFTFTPPAPFAGSVELATAPLHVENPYDFPVENHPVTSGVPFADGELGDIAHLRLLAPDGSAIPFQAKATGRWRDGSIKWTLISFPADISAGETAEYMLEYGTAVEQPNFETPLSVRRNGEKVTVETGPLRVEFDAARSGFPVRATLSGRDVLTESVQACVSDAEGISHTSSGPAESIEIEEEGVVRTVIHTKGHHCAQGGDPFFAYEARFVFYAGMPFFRMYYAWGNDREDLFSHFKSVTLRVPLGEAATPRWALGLGDGKQITGEGDVTLRQLRHDAFELDAEAPSDAALKRADGRLDAKSGDTGLMLAVRDFWQLYPRSFAVREGSVEAGLSASFPEGYYDGADLKDMTHYYFYLQDGKYKIRQGVRKWHELLLLFHDAEPGDAAQIRAARVFNEPLIAVASPERYSETRVFGSLMPFVPGKTDWYDEACDWYREYFERRREDETWYGMMNFGDKLGDPNYNVSWLNQEYDHQHGFALQFARTGNRGWYFLAEKASRHACDVDVCQYGPRTGANWSHTLGHTGDYFDHDPLENSNLWAALDAPDHSWAEGFCDWHYISGDPVARETGKRVVDYISGEYLNNFDFSNGRSAGWPLILIMAGFNLTGDPYYLNAARIIVERVLERQTPGPRGWHRQMIPAHCYCTPPHRGGCVYMISILCRGLENYYDATGDRCVIDAMVGGADQIVDDMWSPESGSFAGTSCPAGRQAGSGFPLGVATKEDPGKAEVHPLFMGVPCQALLVAHIEAGRPGYVEIVRKAMNTCFDYGPPDVVIFPWWVKTLYYLDRINSGKEGRI